LNQYIDLLKQFFEKKSYIKVAYLFGSQAEEKASPLSDVDIGVLIDEKMGKEQRLELKLELISELSKLLKTDKIDLIIMNNASINLNYEIIKCGKILFEKDAASRILFESMILSKYLDRRYYEKRSIDLFLEKIKKEEAINED